MLRCSSSLGLALRKQCARTLADRRFPSCKPSLSLTLALSYPSPSSSSPVLLTCVRYFAQSPQHAYDFELPNPAAYVTHRPPPPPAAPGGAPPGTPAPSPSGTPPPSPSGETPPSGAPPPSGSTPPSGASPTPSTPSPSSSTPPSPSTTSTTPPTSTPSTTTTTTTTSSPSGIPSSQAPPPITPPPYMAPGGASYSSATAPGTEKPTINPASPPPPPRKKRVKKPEAKPEDPVVAEFNAFKNRLQLARLRGKEGEQEAERELETNAQNGLQDKNKRAVEVGLMEIYDTLFPLGFHSVWLYGLGKKYSGYEFVARYLLKNKGKNWVLFVPRRQINLWQECARDFLTSCYQPLVNKEINVSDVLDILTVNYIDTLERDKYTFLDDQIEKPTILPVKDVVKFTADTLSAEILVKFYTRLVTEHPLIMQNLKPEELRDLIAEAIARLEPDHAAELKKDVRAAEPIQNMTEVKDLIDGTTTVRPPPAFTPPTPEDAPPAVVETPAGEKETPINPASS